MTDKPTIEHRCSRSTPCCEVVERLRGADRSAAEGFVEVAAQLRETAERFAEIHHFGQDEER